MPIGKASRRKILACSVGGASTFVPRKSAGTRHEHRLESMAAWRPHIEPTDLAGSHPLATRACKRRARLTQEGLWQPAGNRCLALSSRVLETPKSGSGLQVESREFVMREREESSGGQCWEGTQRPCGAPGGAGALTPTKAATGRMPDGRMLPRLTAPDLDGPALAALLG
jgi:hypothetical protein